MPSLVSHFFSSCQFSTMEDSFLETIIEEFDPWLFLICLSVLIIVFAATFLMFLIAKDYFYKKRDLMYSKTICEKQIPLKRKYVALLSKNDCYLLNKIEKETGTKISFVYDTLRNPDRQVAITGPVFAIRDAFKKMSNYAQHIPYIDMYEMSIPWNKLHNLIGKEKKIVEGIQLTTGASILIRSEVDNLLGTIGKVIITGTCREISKAVPLVEEKIKNYSGNEINQKFGQIDKSYVKPPLKFLDMAGMGPDIHVHVIITSIVNPKSFFIQVCALHNLEYDDLQNEMQEFYNNSTNLKMLELFDVRRGQIVAVKNQEGIWHRCEILHVNDNHCFINYIDIGIEGSAGRKNIYDLPQHFLKYVVQSYECSLNNVGLPENEDWSREAVTKFRELCDVTSPEKLCLHVKHGKIVLNPKGFSQKRIYLVDLYRKDKNIGTALLKEKLAVKENSIKKYYLEIPKSDSNQLEECSEQYKMYKQFQNELDEEFEEKPNVEELESDDDEGFEIGDHIDLATLLSTTGNNKIQDYLPSDFNLNQSSLNNDEV